MQEVWAQSLGREDPPEKEMATHPVISWTGEPGGLLSTGSQRVRHDLATKKQRTICPTLRRLQSKILMDWIDVLEMFIKIVSICGDDDIIPLALLFFFQYLFILAALGVSWGRHDLVP